MVYHTADGRDLTREWYDNQDADIQAKFDSILKILEGTEDLSRYDKLFSCLKKNHRGLCEIRFWIVKEKKFRPVGFFTFNYHQFVLVLGCHKIGGLYYPPDAFDVALELRRKFLEDGRGSIHEREF
jgi:hypothetical protein